MPLSTVINPHLLHRTPTRPLTSTPSAYPSFLLHQPNPPCTPSQWDEIASDLPTHATKIHLEALFFLAAERENPSTHQPIPSPRPGPNGAHDPRIDLVQRGHTARALVELANDSFLSKDTWTARQKNAAETISACLIALQECDEHATGDGLDWTQARIDTMARAYDDLFFVSSLTRPVPVFQSSDETSFTDRAKTPVSITLSPHENFFRYGVTDMTTRSDSADITLFNALPSHSCIGRNRLTPLLTLLHELTHAYLVFHSCL